MNFRNKGGGLPNRTDLTSHHWEVKIRSTIRGINMKNDKDTKKDTAQIIGEKLTGGYPKWPIIKLMITVSNPWLLSGP